MRIQRAESPALLNGQEAARRFFAPYLEAEDPSRECLWVAHVDGETRCLQVECYEGDSTSVGIPIRDIIVDAVRLGSAGIVLAHNHPSGEAHPSEADHRATRKLAIALESVDIMLLDHLIFANGRWSSMRRMGLV